MDDSAPRDTDFEADLENGEEESSINTTKKFANACGGRVDGEMIGDNVEEVEGAENEKITVSVKHKKSSNKKPPRPPKGPSMDASDKELIREISELAMLKRARIEPMKALKKTKPVKSNSNIFAMVFTIMFLFVILFQGMSRRPPDGSIPAQHYGNQTPNLVEQVARLRRFMR